MGAEFYGVLQGAAIASPLIVGSAMFLFGWFKRGKSNG